MVLTRRRKALMAVLALYWPVLFVLTHIPMPEVVRRAHMSDKSLHLLSYMILAILLWSVVKPFEKVDWRRGTVWRVFVAVMVYGVVDECMQHYVANRSTDAWDLLADAMGAFGALGLLTVFSFWPACVVAAGITIYTLAVFTRANLTALLPVTTTVFHLANYAVFTLLWMGCLRQLPLQKGAGRIAPDAAILTPVALMVVTKLSAVVSGKAFEGWDMVAALGGILAAVAGVSVIDALGRRRKSAADANPS